MNPDFFQSISNGALPSVQISPMRKDANIETATATVESPEALAALLYRCGEEEVAVVVGKPQSVSAPGWLATEKLQRVLFLDMSRLNGVVEHRRADQVISVECGMTVGELHRILEENSQWWPVSAPADSTIYDVIASGDGGWLEHGFDGPRHLVLGLTAALSTGKLIKTGGKVVKNVTGYDVTKLFVGSRGTLGLPTVAHLRLYAKPASSLCLVLKSPQLEHLLQYAANVISSGLPVHVLEILHTSLLPQLLGDDDAFCAVLKVFEHERVIAEVLPQLQSLSQPQVMQETVGAEFASVLEQAIAHLRYDMIELAVPLSYANDVVALSYRCLGVVGVWLRPGAGRMRLSLPNAKKLQQFEDELERWCSDSNKSLTMAIAEQNTFRAWNVPGQDQAAGAIIRSLKHQFDPKGCLNPYASFH